jgi:hypothetical protein
MSELPAPESFDPAFAASGEVIACDHKPQDRAWFVAATASAAGARLVGSRSVVPAERDGWIAELGRRGHLAGWTYGGSGIVWAATGDRFTIWLPDQQIVRTRADLGDVIGTSAIAADDYVDRMVCLHRPGGRVEVLAVERDDEARVDPTYGRSELLESEGRWCAYCARDLAGWLGVQFEDETFGLGGETAHRVSGGGLASEEPASSRPVPRPGGYPRYYAVNDRPVKLVQLPSGEVDALVLDATTGGFVSDPGSFSRISGGGDVDRLKDVVAFEAAVAAQREAAEERREVRSAAPADLGPATPYQRILAEPGSIAARKALAAPGDPRKALIEE